MNTYKIHHKLFSFFLASIVLLPTALSVMAQDAQPVLGRAVPREILDPPWLPARKQAQLQTASEFAAFIDFKFSDRISESGISFRNRVVEDAAITYKAVHYDHGNGIAVADVDLDGKYDIYFVNQVGGNELWRNLGGGKFEDITARAGVAVDDRIGVTATFADIDNDGDADLYVTSVRRGNLLFENQGDGRFEDITKASGLGHKGHSSGAVFFDYNRDGLLDVYLTNVGQYTTELLRIGKHEDIEYRFYDGLGDAFGGHNMPERFEKNLLFKNTGGNRFEDVTDIMRNVDTGWAGDASIIDLNEDGWPDIYELNMHGHDQYYENQGGESFLLKSREVFPKTSWGAMGIKVFDWNNDGLMDIFITDMHSDMSKEVGPDDEHTKSDMQWNEAHLHSGGNSTFGNTFFENQGDGKFLEVSDKVSAETYWPWGVSTGDLNADGYQDIFVTAGMNYPFRYQSNTLLINDKGTRFRPAEFILGVEPRKDRKTAQPWFDLDCGRADQKSHRLCTGTNGLVQAWGALGSRSSVIFDLDNDGDLDIVSNEFNNEPMVLISDLAQTERKLNYLKIKLIGSRSNKGGIGAKVVVKTAGASYSQNMDGKSGYLSQSLKPLYFGLGDATEVTGITVHWPSGTTQAIESPKLNTLLEITEPDQ
jgi:hypothetical protein